ncbi:MAG: class I SAM-dependent methyltransferase [Patescibacteria group bacterium]|jgi:2-polyprenyl-3-methyl-5-hydroxy-6-metoxy-1,4-benzoquinol methylase
MKKNQSILTERYLETAPIGQADTVGLKHLWLEKNLIKYFPGKSARLLDIGPGQGEALLFWQKLGYKNISSIDISADVAKHIKKLGFECDLVESDADYLNKRSGTYDLIYISDVLEHVPKDEIVDLVVAIRTGLRSGGKVIIKVPNAQSPHATVGLFGDLTHVQAFTESSLTQLLIASGFKNYFFLAEKLPLNNLKSWIATYIIMPMYFFWIRLIRSATGHSSPKILTQAIIAIAEK